MNKRPILSIPMTMVENVLNVLSVILLVSISLYIFFVWNKLPEKIPTHFNIAGEVDGWGGKGSLWILPVMGLFLYTVLSILSRFPHVFNYPFNITEENAPRLCLESRRMMVILNFELISFFSLISWESVQAAYGKGGMTVWQVPIFLIVVIGSIVILIYRLYRLR